MRAISLFPLLLFLSACATAPVTGRPQLILISPQQSVALGIEAYDRIKRRMPIVTGTEEARRVARVGRAIAAVIPSAEGFEWEFTLFEADEANAFALPGGKVGVNTGLFKVAKNDAQLAAVLGHEIAHVTARHAAERMSRNLVTELGLGILGAATRSRSAVDLAAAAATLGAGLPFSRAQEAEADHIGLIYMAKAGYDPREAIRLWRNFAAFDGDRPPPFLSTHPAPENRIALLERELPEALAVYEAAQREQRS